MSRINEAYNVLKDGVRRAAYDRKLGLQQVQDQSVVRPPGAGECTLCGQAPAESFVFQHQTGLLITRRSWTSEGVFCRQCAMALGRSKLNRTLWTGWWGIISSVTNLVAVIRNMSGLARVRHMPTPHRIDRVVAPIASPLDPGKPILKRSGPWFVALLVMPWVVLGVSSERHQQHRPATAAQVFSWQVGSCVQGSATLVSPVDCASPHVGRIVGVTTSSSGCRDHYVTRPEAVYCISTSQ
jgi:hypothetical protein